MAKRITRDCKTCREIRGKPEEPKMGQLPNERVMVNQSPFSAVAMDFAGEVKLLERGEECKQAILVIVCMTSRVVHLELTQGMASRDVLAAWKRFTLKRGVFPSYVFTDSAKAFQKVKPIIEKECVASLVRKPTDEKLTWEFCHPHAPHRRGVVKTIIKSVKEALKSVNNERLRTREDWETTLCEVTYLLNQRPLVNVSEDYHVLPITGNWLLHPYTKSGEERDIGEMIKSAKEATKQFWEAWMQRIPNQLFHSEKWTKNTPNPSVGDEVLIVKAGYGNKPAPRKYWEKGKITACFASKDGTVRSVEVETTTGAKERHVVQNIVIISNVQDPREEEKKIID